MTSEMVGWQKGMVLQSYSLHSGWEVEHRGRMPEWEECRSKHTAPIDTPKRVLY